jgi:hypothetical protein
MSPAFAIAASTAFFVISLNRTRRNGFPFRRRRERLLKVPRDRLALAVRVRREVHRVGLRGGALQLLERLLLAVQDLVRRLVGVLAVHAQPLLRKVPDVAVGSEHAEVLAQEFLEGAGLGRRLDDDEVVHDEAWDAAISTCKASTGASCTVENKELFPPAESHRPALLGRGPHLRAAP